MEAIKIQFLGTGNMIPTKLRNHTSILLSYANENILVDCGEGTQRQFRIAGISPCKITHLLITHWHGDHMLGIPGLMQTLAMSEYNKTLKVYGPIGTKRFFSLIESLILGFKIKMEIHEVSSGIFIEEKDFFIESLPMQHGIQTNAYSFVIKNKIRLDKKKLKKFKLPNSPLLGELQHGKDIVFNGKKIKAKDVSYLEKGKKVSFILDTILNENAFKLAKDADLLVCESSFSSEEKERAKEYQHLTAADAAAIAKKAKAKKLILTHISQRYEHMPKIIEKEAKKIFKNVQLVKDFDVVVV
ncbi:MAG: ribonuclease Z [Nanoarchaeota archaeon]